MNTLSNLLVEEHRKTEWWTGALRQALDPPDLEAIGRCVCSLQEIFSIHCRNEQAILFPAIRQLTVVPGIPHQALAHKHEVGQKCFDEVRALLRTAKEDPSFTASLVESCRYLSTLLRDRMWEEEHFIFPRLDEALSGAQREELITRMEAAEAVQVPDTRLRRILVPLDGSPESETSVRTAILLAQACSAELALVTILDNPEAALDARPHLGRSCKLLAERTIKADWHLRVGAPAREILRLSQELKVDYIAMSTHGRSGLPRVLMGSVTEDVLRHADVPVLVSRPGTASASWDPIVVALDGSALAAEILPEAGAIAKALGCRLHVIEVADPVLLPGMESPPQAFYPLRDPTSHLKTVCDLLGREGVDARPIPLVGEPAAEIARHALQVGAGLICMTTHGRTGLPRWFLGSTAEEVLRHAPCPVLVRRTSLAAKPVLSPAAAEA